MASLKEIKGRINSVKSTQKITSAMKMVASAKLRKAQAQIEHFLPYQTKLTEILSSFLASETEFKSNLAEVREIKKVAVVAISSNSSLCGAFNSNVIKLLNERLNHYKTQNCHNIEIYPIGKKVEDYCRKSTLPFIVKGSYIDLMDKPNFDGAKEIAQALIKDFLGKEVDCVEIIYNHFKSNAVQIPTREQFLPISLEAKTEGKDSALNTDYIIEPDKETIMEVLIPKSLNSKIYAVILDSAAAEQAARTVAMQIATDNADDILDELTIQYNKQRQSAITTDLQDVVSGSEALK